jgi:hypothetical protein
MPGGYRFAFGVGTMVGTVNLHRPDIQFSQTRKVELTGDFNTF